MGGRRTRRITGRIARRTKLRPRRGWWLYPEPIDLAALAKPVERLERQRVDLVPCVKRTVAFVHVGEVDFTLVERHYLPLEAVQGAMEAKVSATLEGV